MRRSRPSVTVYVLGDENTSQRLDALAAAAAGHGAVIAKTFAFGSGEAAATNDLSTVDAVVEALGRAIAEHRPIWVPFWEDLFREQHVRSLSLVLQRHGLNLYVGPQMAPIPQVGGINLLDAAVRHEIRDVFRLDDAAMVSAGATALVGEIEEFLAEVDPPPPAGESAPDGEPRVRHFGTAGAAALLGKSPNWVSRGLREKVFGYADGSPVEPLRDPDTNRHALTVPMVRAIAWSAYRRGTLSRQRLEEVLAALREPR